LIAGGDLPRPWSDLLKLARAGKVLMPGIPVDTLMNFYMVCSTLGEDVAQSAERVVST
jgi:multiple sugar transport system substrate-binding protein